MVAVALRHWMGVGANMNLSLGILPHFLISLAILPKIPDCCVGFFWMRGANVIFLLVFFIHTVIFYLSSISLK
jgi:hypothetical protein